MARGDGGGGWLVAHTDGDAWAALRPDGAVVLRDHDRAEVPLASDLAAFLDGLVDGSSLSGR